LIIIQQTSRAFSNAKLSE